MPKEHRKRGRREEKKRKREEEEEEEEEQAAPSKRQKSEDVEEKVDNGGDEAEIPEGYPEYASRPGDLPFYGLLDEDEQEYFKRADSMLELNQFTDADERNLFLANVYKEAGGKELKIANSQSCSRLMERLILLSTPGHLKNLFQKFSGHFLHLVQHRFASHCCEALFLQAAPIVNQELVAPVKEKDQNLDGADVYVSMENLFLYTLNELEDNLGYLMSDRFASHPLRILLVVLSGMPLAATSSSSVLQSKKKEHVSVTGGKLRSREEKTEVRMVPDSFHCALEKMMARAVAGLDTTYLRALATHPIANPVLQLLLELELTRSGKQIAKDPKSLFRKFVPDDTLEDGTESVSFINSLVYDTIGSRLLEVIIINAPGKTFRALYRASFKGKIGTFAKNEVAVFVAIKIIERLNKEDLVTALTEICSQIDTLVERSRTSVIKTLIERCRVRHLDASSISTGLEEAYGERPSERLVKMLRVSTGPTDGMAEDRRKQLDSNDSGKAHGSLLAQCMLETPGPLRELICGGLLAMETPLLITIAKDRTASRVLQTALVCSEQAAKFRRLLIPRFYGHMEYLTVDPVASHLVDSLWEATNGLTFIRERIANELAQHESTLRASISGRAVWRNWTMDVYKTRRKDWLNDAKGQSQDKDRAKPAKTGIELARERFAAGTRKLQHKAMKAKRDNGTGANSMPQGTATVTATIEGKA
ncbi:MAG: Nucleolar protein 9 [Alectoria fallacina]|uniref:Nucleolar protein 9 n=1 Tax=Alectoria fallacina TaxID=1903189 RepID=A0A8H3IG76_9LECA|nr:MAG: Nucleolar protein 9 [Alectoria fallacina]